METFVMKREARVIAWRTHPRNSRQMTLKRGTRLVQYDREVVLRDARTGAVRMPLLPVQRQDGSVFQTQCSVRDWLAAGIIDEVRE